jgi:group I intron endonuclease
MLVYRVTNQSNGKTYIGKTVQTVERRWEDHVWDATSGRLSSLLHRAIRKYGRDAFKVEILHQAKGVVELSSMETFFIIIHQSHHPENGYNMTLGGEGGAQFLPSVLAKMALHGDKNPRFGKKWSSEMKSQIGRTQQNRVFTQAHRDKLKEAWARRKAAI